MNMTEFMRLTQVLEKLGYNSDTILLILKYLESGDNNILDKINK